MRTLPFAALPALLLAAPTATAQNEFFDLGGNTPSGLSADGSVAVGTNAAGYFHWSVSGDALLLGGTPAGGGVGGQAKVSNDGTRVCGTFFNAVSGFNEMSVWDLGTGSWTPLGGIGASSGSEISSGWGVSGDGTSVVGLGWAVGGGAHAIQWTEGGTTVDLGSTVPGNSSRANGVDDDGDVVVGWQDAGFRQGAVWVNGVQTLVTETGTGAALGEASDVTGDGTWVCGIGTSANGNEPWRWSAATGGESLGTLPGIFNPSGLATGISADGSTIVGTIRAFGQPATFGQGFLWREDLGLVNLTDYMNDIGATLPAGYTLALPLAISDDGTTITGLGRQGFAASGFVLRVRALRTDRHALSLSAGGTQTLDMSAGADNGGSFYWMFGSFSGTTPGFTLGAVSVPLNVDAYTLLTVNKPNLGAFGNFVGFLDAQGDSQASFSVPAGADPTLAGIVLHHAYVAAKVIGIPDYVSNAASVALQP